MKISCEGLLKRGDRVAVALSGGEDSVALFHALIALESELGIEVLALNVEHGIRGAASVADTAFVKKMCDNVRKRALFYSVDAPAYAREHGMSLETAARELRYQCYFKALDAGLCDKVATAHHAGDNVESVLLNVFRGCGIGGLKGIPESSYCGRIIRPMLSVTKDEIREYTAKYGLLFVTDESNRDDGYSRNFLRNRVIPLIKERFPDFENSVVRLSAIAGEYDEYVREEAEKLVTEKDGDTAVLLAEGATVAPPVMKQAVIIAFKSAGLKKDYEEVHVSDVAALSSNQVGAGVDLPHGYRAERTYGAIIIYNDNSAKDYEFPFKEGKFDLPGGTLSIVKTTVPKMDKMEKVAYFAQKRAEGVLYISADVPEGAVVRTRRSGDVIKKFGGGSKSLKEYLADLKIPGKMRAVLPVCAVKNEVYFVCGADISSLAKVEDDSAEAYEITYIRN